MDEHAFASDRTATTGFDIAVFNADVLRAMMNPPVARVHTVNAAVLEESFDLVLGFVARHQDTTGCSRVES